MRPDPQFPQCRPEKDNRTTLSYVISAGAFSIDESLGRRDRDAAWFGPSEMHVMCTRRVVTLKGLSRTDVTTSARLTLPTVLPALETWP